VNPRGLVLVSKIRYCDLLRVMVDTLERLLLAVTN
jgi:hypothetical protein